ncbi:MFS transporter [Halopseudomonas pachastrellae]|nr:MFS transporter [Halopseudomonas pachastrellae]
MSQSSTDANGVLKRSTILLHGSIGMPLAIIGYPLVVYLPPFYAQEVGLNMALMALVLVVARLSDVITDPLIGTLSDRWRTRFGRRKPWLVMGVPLMLAGTVMIFMPPTALVSGIYCSGPCSCIWAGPW